MAFSLVSSGVGALRTQAITLQSGSFNLVNASNELTAVGYDRLTTNVTLTAVATANVTSTIAVSSGAQFSANDKIWISPTGGATGGESATVQSVNGNNLTLASTVANNHAIGEVIHRFTANQTLVVGVMANIDYGLSSLSVVINGSATQLRVVDTSLGGVSTTNAQYYLYVLPILSPQTDRQTTGYTISFQCTNGAGAYESIQFNALTFTGAYTPSSITNSELPKSSGGTIIDGSSGTFGTALVTSSGTPNRIDLGTIPTTYGAQQQPFIAFGAWTNTTYPASYSRIIGAGVNTDASNNVTGVVAGATCTGTAGATTITVSNTSGFITGCFMTITDGANTETVQTVGIINTGTNQTVNLTTALQFNHTSAKIDYATGCLPVNSPQVLLSATSNSVSPAYATAGSSTVYTSLTTFLPANGTVLYISANGVGETCTVSSGGGTNTLVMTSNLSRSYRNGIISTTPTYLNVNSPYGGYTIQATGVCAQANAGTLNGASGTGTKTSLTVNPLLSAIGSGVSLLLRQASSPTTTITVVTSASVGAGATSIPINSISFGTSFASGTTLVNTAVVTPFVAGGGLIGVTLYPSNATVNNLQSFTQPYNQYITTTQVPLIATTSGQSSSTSSTVNGMVPYPSGTAQYSTGSSTTAQVYRGGATIGGVIQGTVALFAGYNYGGTNFITPEILINAGGSGTTYLGSAMMYTFVPSTPQITEVGYTPETYKLGNPSQKGRVANAVNAVLEATNAVASKGRNVVHALTKTFTTLATKVSNRSGTATELETFATKDAKSQNKSLIIINSEAFSTDGVKSLSHNETFSQTLLEATSGNRTSGKSLSNSSALSENAIGTKAKEANKSSQASTIQQTNSVTSRVRNVVSSVTEQFKTVGIVAKSTVIVVVGSVVETFATTSVKAMGMVRNNSTALQQVIRDQRSKTIVRNGSKAVSQLTRAGSYKERLRNGVDTTSQSLRDARTKAMSANASVALQQVVRETRIRVMSAFGEVILTQTQSLASYIYRSAETIVANFSENTEKGVYGETSKFVSAQDATSSTFITPNTSSQSFKEDGVSSYREGT